MSAYLEKNSEAKWMLDCISEDIGELADALYIAGNPDLAKRLQRHIERINSANALHQSAFDELFNKMCGDAQTRVGATLHHMLSACETEQDVCEEEDDTCGICNSPISECICAKTGMR
jgi:hypothetical protein